MSKRYKTILSKISEENILQTLQYRIEEDGITFKIINETRYEKQCRIFLTKEELMELLS